MKAPQKKTGAQRQRPDADLLRAAYDGDLALVRTALEEGTPVETSDERSGLTALHIAVGTNNLPLARYLVEEWHASFGLDNFGRWPTLIAAECQVDDELSDYIVEQEALYLEEDRTS